MIVPRGENYSMIMSKNLSPCKNAKIFTHKIYCLNTSCFLYMRKGLYPSIFEDLDTTKINRDKMKSIGNKDNKNKIDENCMSNSPLL